MTRTSVSSELMGWVMVLVGVMLAIAAGRQAADLFTADQGWTPVSATVVRTRIVADERSQTGPSLRKAQPNAGSEARTYRIYQELVYFVKERRYQASLEVGRVADRSAALEAIRTLNQAGSSTGIWVDARNPARVEKEPVQREASIGIVTLFALLGLLALQFGSGLIRAASRGQHSTGAAASGVRANPVPSH